VELARDARALLRRRALDGHAIAHQPLALDRAAERRRDDLQQPHLARVPRAGPAAVVEAKEPPHLAVDQDGDDDLRHRAGRFLLGAGIGRQVVGGELHDPLRAQLPHQAGVLVEVHPGQRGVGGLAGDARHGPLVLHDGPPQRRVGGGRVEPDQQRPVGVEDGAEPRQHPADRLLDVDRGQERVRGVDGRLQQPLPR
jgi:hypothetical protein